MRSARSSSPWEKFETPPARTLPSLIKRDISPHDSSTGVPSVRPVELVEVDALDAEPAKRSLDLLPDRFGLQVALRLLERPRRVRNHPAFGEDVGTLGGRDLAQRPSDHLLGMAEPVDCRGVDPVDSAPDCVADGRDRVGVVLLSPTVGPTSTADGPCSEAHLRDVETASPERTVEQRFHDATSFSCAQGTGATPPSNAQPASGVVVPTKGDARPTR